MFCSHLSLYTNNSVAVTGTYENEPTNRHCYCWWLWFDIALIWRISLSSCSDNRAITAAAVIMLLPCQQQSTALRGGLPWLQLPIYTAPTGPSKLFLPAMSVQWYVTMDVSVIACCYGESSSTTHNHGYNYFLCLC